MLKKIMCFVAIFVLMSGPALATNTATRTDTTVSVVLDGTTNFDLTAVPGVPSNVFLTSIIFKPSAANDYIQVRSGSASGAIIWPANVDITGGGQVLYFDASTQKPYIVASECHFSTAANALVTFVYQKR